MPMPMPTLAPLERPGGVGWLGGGGGEFSEEEPAEEGVGDEDGVAEASVEPEGEAEGVLVAEVELELEVEDGRVKFLGSNSMGRNSMERLDSSLQQSWEVPQHQRWDELPAARLQGVRKGYLSSWLRWLAGLRAEIVCDCLRLLETYTTHVQTSVLLPVGIRTRGFRPCRVGGRRARLHADLAEAIRRADIGAVFAVRRTADCRQGIQGIF